MRLAPLARALASLAAVGLARGAAAQSYSDPGVGLGVDAGVVDSRSADGLSPAFAVHLRYRLTGSLGLEGRIGARRESVDDGAGKLLELVDVPVTATAQLFLFPRTKIQPYLLAGAGLHVVKTAPKGRNTSIGGATEALFAMHTGAGLDVRPSRRSAVHLEARWYFLEPTAVTGLEQAGYAVRPGYLAITAGVTLFR